MKLRAAIEETGDETFINMFDEDILGIYNIQDSGVVGSYPVLRR